MIRHLFATPGNPVRLVKPTEEELAAHASARAELLAEQQEARELIAETVPEAAIEVATNWWVMTPIILVGIAAILTVHLRIVRYRRLSADERAFRSLARAARVPTKFRVLARRLADAKGAPPPVAVLLSDGALAQAAALIEAKPGSPTDRVLTEYLAQRGVADPRAPRTKPRAKKARASTGGRRTNAAA